MDYYLLVKALHVTAVILWIGSMAGLALNLARISGNPGQDPQILRDQLSGLRLLNRRLVEPTMGLAWLIGIGLAIWGDWIPDAWLIAKLVFVIALSALHGMLTGRLKRMEKALKSDGMKTPDSDGFAIRVFWVIPLSVLVVVTIVFIKPF